MDAETEAVVDVDEIVIPKAMAKPVALKYVRSNLLDILREYSVARACIRLAENNAKSMSIDRLHIEGVIQEAFASSDLKGYFAGAIPALAARLGLSGADLKPIIDGKNHFKVGGWDDFTLKQREALLAAMVAGRV
ncbi:hypothetical protein [Mesorhizobium sp. AR10]|uniref:hypothetical protein n=1 Tax=Mesorhizobium sp. AR10 TaxID=2865839 RepID=UPI002160D38C|nr:hypothetical protein [Mesorhizobium sp. AR10]